MERVSVIVCTRDNAENLRQTLDSVGRCHIPEHYEVDLLVVDNGSIDHTKQVVANFQPGQMVIRYLLEPKTGKGNAYNAALAHARGSFLLFTDDDVRVPENWIDEMVTALHVKDLDAVAGGVVLAEHLQRPWLNPRLRGALAATEGLDPQDPYMMIGANMGIRRHVLDKVPAFDPELGPGALGFYEESLFTWQLKRAGYKVGSAFATAIEHHCSSSRLRRNSFLETSKKYGRSEAYVYHHFFHGKKRFIIIRLALAHVRLHVLRAMHPSNWGRLDGASTWELNATYDVGFLSQYLVERQRQRNYTPFGLTKLPPQS